MDERAVERRGLLVGLALVVLTIATIAAFLVVDPPVGRRLAAQAAAHAILGRETGLPTGLALGNPPPLVATLAAAQDVSVLLVGFGLAMMAARGTLRIAWLRRLAERPHEKRDAFAARTETTGVALLALSLWIPFFPGGALVAALLARVAGYRPHVSLPALAASAILADYVYVYALDQVARLVPRWTLPLFALAIAAIVAVVLWAMKRREKRA